MGPHHNGDIDTIRFATVSTPMSLGLNALGKDRAAVLPEREQPDHHPEQQRGSASTVVMVKPSGLANAASHSGGVPRGGQ
jgi:hypothetical protein